MSSSHAFAVGRPALAAAIVLAAMLTLGATEQTASRVGDESLDELLLRAGEYIQAYEQDISAIVADEDYTQRVIIEPGAEIRHLRSDILTIRDDANGWVGFRDVYEVDGHPVRDRTDRLARLFLEPHADSQSQAARIADESARFNLARQVSRTINIPLLALQFIRAQNQNRSTFSDAGTKNRGGSVLRIVAFKERAEPRMIRTDDGAGASGRLWIERVSGRIVETELVVTTRVKAPGRPGVVVTAVINVAYAEQPQMRLWLPVSMDETYRGAGFIVGGARDRIS